MNGSIESLIGMGGIFLTMRVQTPAGLNRRRRAYENRVAGAPNVFVPPSDR